MLFLQNLYFLNSLLEVGNPLKQPHCWKCRLKSCSSRLHRRHPSLNLKLFITTPIRHARPRPQSSVHPLRTTTAFLKVVAGCTSLKLSPVPSPARGSRVPQAPPWSRSVRGRHLQGWTSVLRSPGSRAPCRLAAMQGIEHSMHPIRTRTRTSPDIKAVETVASSRAEMVLELVRAETTQW